MEYTAPAGMELKRKGEYVLTFSMEGYKSEKVEIFHQMRGWMLVWDIFWFPTGIIVDAITGGWYRLSPEEVSITLSKESAGIDGPDQIEVMLSIQKDRLGVNSSSPVHFRIEHR